MPFLAYWLTHLFLVVRVGQVFCEDLPKFSRNVLSPAELNSPVPGPGKYFCVLLDLHVCPFSCSGMAFFRYATHSLHWLLCFPKEFLNLGLCYWFDFLNWQFCLLPVIALILGPTISTSLVFLNTLSHPLTSLFVSGSSVSIFLCFFLMKVISPFILWKLTVSNSFPWFWK